MSAMDRIIADSMDLWEAAADESFLEEMGKGTLDRKLFYEYIIQDSIYLRYYLKAFAMGMFKAATLRDMQFLYSVLGFVNDSENATRLNYLKDDGLTDEDVEKIPMKKACRSYTSFLVESAEKEDFAGILMAVMPCMLGYEYVFRKTKERHPEVMDGYFGPLVSDYTASWYYDCCREWTEYCNKFITDENEKRLSAIFREASRQELIFWQMAGGNDHV